MEIQNKNPIAVANIGGYPVAHFVDPGVGQPAPSPEELRPPGGVVDVEAHRAAVLAWLVDRTEQTSIILSAIVRELVVQRIEAKEWKAPMISATELREVEPYPGAGADRLDVSDDVEPPPKS